MSKHNIDFALLITRVTAGIIFLVHGSQKLFGGLDALIGMLGPVAYLVAIGEFFGGLGLIVGFLSRFSAAANVLIMLGAIVKVHGQHGFFMGQPPGYEYNLALMALLTPTLLLGPGRFALTKFLPFKNL
jgi:putative oxidoreductase